MTHTGILVPADETQPHRLVTWEDTPSGDGLLALPVPGGLRLWCPDDGLMVDEPDFNDRAIGICRQFGYNVDALAGPVVFIGAVQGEDETGLDPTFQAWLVDGLRRMQEQLGELVD